MNTLSIRLVVIALAVFCISSKSVATPTDTVIGTTTPPGAGNSYQKMAHALCDHLPDDRQKANAIYNWITHNISYDVKAMQQGNLKEENVAKVFKQRKGMCEGYSLLFAAMCNEVGINAITINGYAKDWMFDDGDKLYIPRHAWNVVYIDHRWQLVDVTWGAGILVQAPGWLKRQLHKASKNPLQVSGKLKFKFLYDTAYFLSDPLAFRIKHLPSDPVWQLTDTAMPLEVFEAGTVAIQKFNEQYPELAADRTVHMALSQLNEMNRVQVSAERIAEYNPRYRIALAAKHQADAVDTITEKAIPKGTSNNTSGVLKQVQQRLKYAEQEVEEQKKTISTEYTDLKIKNKAKNLEAQEYIRNLHSDNRRMIAQCQSTLSKSKNLTASIKKKAGKAASKGKEVDADKLAGIAAAKNITAEDNPALRSLEDSVGNRLTRIDSIESVIQLQQSEITDIEGSNKELLDSMALIFTMADSALTEETISRIRMHDNYDEEVLQWNRLVKTLRLQQVDSLQKYYFAGYDSVNKQYERLRKNQWEQISLYQKSLKDIERYKRRNDKNLVLLAQYPGMVAAHDTCLNNYYQELADHTAYINGNKGLFQELVRLYKRQEELAGYMDKSESKRKELEEKQLAKKQDFDKKENEKQKQQLKDTGKRAEKMLSLK